MVGKLEGFVLLVARGLTLANNELYFKSLQVFISLVEGRKGTFQDTVLVCWPKRFMEKRSDFQVLLYDLERQ